MGWFDETPADRDEIARERAVIEAEEAALKSQAMNDADLLNRLKAMIEAHHKYQPWGECAAHSEGQSCCIDKILERSDAELADMYVSWAKAFGE